MNEVFDQLKAAMQKEIRLLREILANMHQEELSRLLSDHTMVESILSERSRMIQQLGVFRIERMEALAKLEKITGKSSLEEMLSSEALDILSLRDQISALLDKMNRQLTCNSTLQPLPLPKPKKKGPSITVEEKDN